MRVPYIPFKGLYRALIPSCPTQSQPDKWQVLRGFGPFDDLVRSAAERLGCHRFPMPKAQGDLPCPHL